MHLDPAHRRRRPLGVPDRFTGEQDDIDLRFMDSLAGDEPQWATQFSINELVRQAGTQGIELLMWLAARGTLTGKVRELHRNYHIPISNTAAGLMLIENR